MKPGSLIEPPLGRSLKIWLCMLQIMQFPGVCGRGEQQLTTALIVSDRLTLLKLLFLLQNLPFFPLPLFLFCLFLNIVSLHWLCIFNIWFWPFFLWSLHASLTSFSFIQNGPLFFLLPSNICFNSSLFLQSSLARFFFHSTFLYSLAADCMFLQWPTFVGSWLTPHLANSRVVVMLLALR